MSVPLLGREVESGAVIDVGDAEAAQLLLQPRHWEPADEPAGDLLAKLSTPTDDNRDAEEVQA